MPQNHNAVMTKFLKKYIMLKKIKHIKRLYKEFDKEIKSHSQQDLSYDDGNGPASGTPKKGGKEGQGDNGKHKKPIDSKDRKGQTSGEEDKPSEQSPTEKGEKGKKDGKGKGGKDETEKQETPENDEKKKFRKEKRDLENIEIDDNEDSYSKKSHLMKSITFKQYKKNLKHYNKIFKFEISTKHLFHFLKYCYRFRRIPKNHNEVMNKFLKKYIKLKKIKRIKKLYKEFDKEIKSHTQQDLSYDDENGPESGTPKKGGKEGQGDNGRHKKPISSKDNEGQTSGEGDKTSEQSPTEKTGKKGKKDGKDKGGKDETEKLETTENGEKKKFKKEKKDLKNIEINDNEDSYSKKSHLMKSITFKQYKKNLKHYNKIFKFEISTKHLFHFLKYCYRFRIMPQNHNAVMTKFLKKYIMLKKIKHIKRLYKEFDKEIKSHSQQDLSYDDGNGPDSDKAEEDSQSPNKIHSKVISEDKEKNNNNQPRKPNKGVNVGQDNDGKDKNKNPKPQTDEEKDDSQSSDETLSKGTPEDKNTNKNNKQGKPGKGEKDGQDVDSKVKTQKPKPKTDKEKDVSQSPNKNPSEGTPEDEDKKNNPDKPKKGGKERQRYNFKDKTEKPKPKVVEDDSSSSDKKPLKETREDKGEDNTNKPRKPYKGVYDGQENDDKNNPKKAKPQTDKEEDDSQSSEENRSKEAPEEKDKNTTYNKGKPGKGGKNTQGDGGKDKPTKIKPNPDKEKDSQSPNKNPLKETSKGEDNKNKPGTPEKLGKDGQGDGGINKPKKPKDSQANKGQTSGTSQKDLSNDNRKKPHSDKEEEDSQFSDKKNKLPKDKLRGERQNDEYDSGEEESDQPENQDMKNSEKKFTKEKNHLKRKKITDNKDSYRDKRELLKEIFSFRQLQTSHYSKRFQELFKFQIKTRHLFYFIKHCYRFKSIPKNFNRVMNKVLKTYTEIQEINDIRKLYKIYDREIKFRSEKDTPDDKENIPQTDENTKKGDQSKNKKPPKNTPGGNGRKRKNEPEIPKRSWGKGEEDKPEEPEEFTDNSNQQDSEDDRPSKKLPKHKEKVEEQNIENDTGEEEGSVKPGNQDTEDNKNKFKKEKNELKSKKIFDDEHSYKDKRDLLREINSFERYQSRRYLKRFRDLFKFQIRTRRLFRFIKYCYQFKRIPKNFNQVMNKIIRMYTKLEKIHEINRLYKKYQKEIKPRSEKDILDDDEDQPQTDEGTQEDNDRSANKKPSQNTSGDNGSKRKNKSKKTKINRGKRGEYEPEEREESTYDSSQPDSEDDRPSKKLPSNKSGVKKGENAERGEDESIKSEYTKDDEKKFIEEKNDLKSLKITDDEDSYEEKCDLLKTMTFQQYQSRRYLKRIFKFHIRTRSLFNFIKYWYRFQIIPRNHDEVINKVLKMYSKLRKSNEINKLYKVYDKEIKPRSQRNAPNEDYQRHTDEEDESPSPYKRPYKGIPKDNGSERKDKSEKEQKGVGKDKEDEDGDEPAGYKSGKDLNDNGNNEMMHGKKNARSESEENMPKGKSRNPSTTGPPSRKNRGSSPYSSNKESEAEDLNNNSVIGRNSPDNSQRKDAQTFLFKNIQDSEKTYLTKHLFLRYLTFKQYNFPRNMDKFYKLFGFRIRTKLVFKIIKHCYRFKRMPKNHNRVLNKLLSILKIMCPNTLHKYLHFFLKKYDEGVNLYSNEDLRKAENKNPKLFNGRENNNKYKDFSNNKANKGADGKSFFENRIGNEVTSIFKPNVILKNRPNFNRGNVPEGEVNQGKDSTKNQDDSDVEHIFEKDEESKLGNNNPEIKTNNPQTGSKPYNRNPQYFNGQTGSGYNAYENINKIINNINQQQRKPPKTSQNDIQNHDDNFQNVFTPHDISEQFNSFPYDNKNPLTDSMSTSMNQQPSFNPNFNIQGSNENENPIPFSTYENYNSQKQKTNNYQRNSMTYNSNQQYNKIPDESQYSMRHDNNNPLLDSMSIDMNQQPSFAQTALGYNSKNYYANDLQTNSMISSMNQKQYNNEYNSFQKGLDNGVPDVSQNNMQDTRINSQKDYAYDNYNSQNQNTNNYQRSSMTYNSNQQHDKIPGESQYNMRYDNNNPLLDSMSNDMNQQPSFAQSTLGYNSENYYANDLQTNSMISSMNQKHYNNEYNSFQKGLDNGVPDGSQNNMQDARINSQKDYALYTNVNQQSVNSRTAASYQTQNDNFQTDSLPYEQNLLNDMGQTENADFLNGYRKYKYAFQPDIQQNQPVLEEGFN